VISALVFMVPWLVARYGLPDVQAWWVAA